MLMRSIEFSESYHDVVAGAEVPEAVNAEDQFADMKQRDSATAQAIMEYLLSKALIDQPEKPLQTR